MNGMITLNQKKKAMVNRKENNQKIAAYELKKLVNLLNPSYLDELNYALEQLEATVDDKSFIIGKLDAVVHKINNILRNKKISEIKESEIFGDDPH